LVVGISYNQPKLCPSATWNPDAITLSTGSTSLSTPMAIFVNSNNTIYVTYAKNNEVLVWQDDSVAPTRIISGIKSNFKSIFVTANGDIYLENDSPTGRVDKWSLNTNTFDPVRSFTSSCYGLFVDINDTLYCSIHDYHQVVKTWLCSNATTVIPVAGMKDSSDSTSDKLCNPYGIFVDIDFDLYVADSWNNRIQRFRSGQRNGITVAGSSSTTATITLYYPTGVVLDADKHLYIVEEYNNRIVRSGPNGSQCIIGCSGQGSSPHQLKFPISLSFDSVGNIFVADQQNSRVQKFFLSTNSYSKHYNYTSLSSIMRNWRMVKLTLTFSHIFSKVISFYNISEV
jgi:hypothetical protein